MSEKIRLCHVRAQADFCVPAAARKERKMYIINTLQTEKNHVK